MKSIIIIMVAIFFSNIYSQSLWQIHITAIPKDTSKESLKSIILDEYSIPYDYENAAFYLAYYYKETESQWLFENLNTSPILDKSTPLYVLEFDKYVIDQIVRGYLGDQSSIPNLQAAIDSIDYIVDKIIADRYLAEAGVYNNFNLIKNAFLDTNYRLSTLQGLWTYANSTLYRDEVISLFEQAILSSDKANDVSSYAGYLYWIDKNLTLELLDEKFEELMGWNRQSLFIELYKFDPDNQPRRSMWAIPLEPDEKLRAYYIPFFPSIASGIFPKVYLQPFWINFLRNWYEVETSGNIKDDIIWFIYDFRPLSTEEDLNMSVTESIEKLSGQVDSVYNYTWLVDLLFRNELQNILLSAKTNLQNGDSLACREDVKSFQGGVDYVFADSLNADPRFVTIEGWKFLYWNAQYILDRLPAIPIVIAADIDVINPAMSLVNPGAFTMEVKGSGFSSSSVVYFNSNARTTTFVSDSILNAAILASDISVAGNFPVWVSDNSLNSDTLIYKVVSTLPQPVRPVLECVTNNGDGTYTAFFGYKNENSVSVYIPVGSKNKFTPNPQDRGQTRVFKPGRQIKVYTVNFNGSNLVWTLNGRTSTASANSAPCQ